MSAQVFISYSNQDRAVAESIHDALEKAGIPAWLAHRDLTAGVPWSQRIIDEIHASRVMILILSHHANESQYVIREVGEAVERQTSILTVRIEDIAPSRGLKFFIGAEQWLDAFALPKEQYRKRLIEDVRLILNTTPQRPESPAQPVAAAALDVAHATTAAPARPPARLPAGLREHPFLVRGALVVIALVAVVVIGMRVLPAFQPDVVIATEPGELFIGDTLALALHSTHDDSVIWSSSNTEVIGISPGRAVARALSAGTALLTAEAGGRSNTLRVTVWPARVASIAVMDLPSSIRVGESWMFSLTAKDVAGRNIAHVAAHWSSETPRVLTIDSAGLATGLAAGRGRVSVQVDTLVATVNVTIVAAPPDRIVDPGRTTPRARDATPVNTPVRPSLPSATELTRWADLCLARLKAKDVQWVETNYRPPTRADQDILDRLKFVMGQNRYNVSASNVGEAQPETRSIDFWAEFSYATAFGRNLKERATFRVLASNALGDWRMASCRTVGALTAG